MGVVRSFICLCVHTTTTEIKWARDERRRDCVGIDCAKERKKERKKERNPDARLREVRDDGGEASLGKSSEGEGVDAAKGR